MKYKFILASTLAALQASAANWDALVAAAAEAGITEAASLDAASLLQRLTDAPPSSLQSQQSQQSQLSQDQSDQIRQLATDLADRDQKIKNQRTEIENQKSKIENLKAQLGKKPGATPAMAVTETDPPSNSDKTDIGCLTGKESFVDSLDRIASWL